MTPAKELIKTLKIGDRVRFEGGTLGEVRLRGKKKWIWVFWSLNNEGYDDWSQDAMNWLCEKIEPTYIHGQGKADMASGSESIRKQDRADACQSKGKEFPAEKNSLKRCSGRPLKPKEIVLEGEVVEMMKYIHIGKTTPPSCGVYLSKPVARKLGLKDKEKVRIRIGKA